jgi:hypothetical protein
MAIIRKIKKRKRRSAGEAMKKRKSHPLLEGV